MAWTVEVTDQFEAWWDALTEDERVSIDGMIHVLEQHGPALGPPYSSGIAGSRFSQLRQLRVPHHEREICVLYISDDERATLILLTGTTVGTAVEPCPPEDVERADFIYGTYIARRRNPQ